MDKAESGRQWLLTHLADCREHVAGGVLTEGIRAGYTEQTLRRAANALKVQRQTATYGRSHIELWALLPDAHNRFLERQRLDAERHACAVHLAQQRTR